MLDGLKPYPENQLAHPWLGAVPASWTLTTLGATTTRRSARNRTDLPLLSVLREKGVVPRSSLGEDENHNFIPDDLSNYRVAFAGDLVVNKMKAWQGSVGIAPCDGIVSPAYFVFALFGITQSFAHRLFRSKPYVAFFGQSSDGVRIGQWDLSIDRMKRIPVPLPPPAEQAAIVRFLEAVDRKVNRFIRAKRRLIEVLTEQKQAIITHAVTRGLNPDARLKPSGIDWLGEVPEHWKTMRLGRSVDLITGFPFPSSGFTQNDADVPLLRGVNVAPGSLRWSEVVRWPDGDSTLASFQLKAGDVVLGMDRPVISTGVRVAVLRESDLPCLLLQRVCRLRAREGLRQPYIPLLLIGRAFADYLAPIFTGISVPHISPEQIRSFRVVLPPVEEQDRILEYVADQTRNVNAIIGRTEREIDLIREYRTRLVADVVTGKLDVRGVSVGDDADRDSTIDTDVKAESLLGDDPLDACNADDDPAPELEEAEA